MRLCDQIHAPAFFITAKKCAVSLGGWLEPKSGLNTVTKKNCVRSESNPDSQVVQAIAQLLY
jgi:hypothetical protein